MNKIKQYTIKNNLKSFFITTFQLLLKNQTDLIKHLYFATSLQSLSLMGEVDDQIWHR